MKRNTSHFPAHTCPVYLPIREGYGFPFTLGGRWDCVSIFSFGVSCPVVVVDFGGWWRRQLY